MEVTASAGVKPRRGASLRLPGGHQLPNMPGRAVHKSLQRDGNDKLDETSEHVRLPANKVRQPQTQADDNEIRVQNGAETESPSSATETQSSNGQWVTKDVRALRLCNHLFHAQCLSGWMSEQKFDCPVCRVPFWGAAHCNLVASRAAARLHASEGGRELVPETPPPSPLGYVTVEQARAWAAIIV